MRNVTVFGIAAVVSVSLISRAATPVEIVRIGNFDSSCDDNIEAIITIVEFNTGDHDTTRIDDSLIDMKISYGFDGCCPHRQIGSIHIITTQSAYNLPTEMFSDCYNPSSNGKSYSLIQTTPETMMLTMAGSDGAGAYFVIWVISPDSIVRIVDNEELSIAFVNTSLHLE